MFRPGTIIMVVPLPLPGAAMVEAVVVVVAEPGETTEGPDEAWAEWFSEARPPEVPEPDVLPQAPPTWPLTRGCCGAAELAEEGGDMAGRVPAALPAAPPATAIAEGS